MKGAKIFRRKRGWGALLRLSAERTLADGIPSRGAALAFYAMLSITPMLVLLLKVTSFIYNRQAAGDQIQYLVTRFAGAQEADAVNSILTASSSQQGGVTLFSLVILLFGASGVFTQLQNTLNDIWKAPAEKRETLMAFAKEHFISFVAVVSAGLLFVLSMGLGTALAAFLHSATEMLPALAAAAEIFVVLSNFAVTAVIFACSLKFLPRVEVAWRAVWPGAALTALLFTLGQFLIGFYIGHTNLAAGFGAAGPMVALIVWIYYSAQIYFFGAEFTRVYAEREGL